MKLIVGRILFALVAAVCIGFVVLSCRLFAYAIDLVQNGLECEEATITNVEQINQSASIKLPSNAQKAEGFFTGRDHCLTYVRFEMNASDFPQFLATTRIKSPLSSIDDPLAFIKPPSKLNWDMSSIASNLGGYSISSLDYNQRILIDTSNPNRYIVYFVTHHED